MTKVLILLLCLALSRATPSSVTLDSLPPIHTAVSQAAVALSWRLRGAVADADAHLRESAYELRVTRGSATVLHLSQPVAHAGTALLQAAELARLPVSTPLRYSLRVRLGDDTWTPWAEDAEWRVGPGAHAAEWPGNASWICTSPTGATDSRSSILRTEFALPGDRTVVAAVLHVTGLGQYRISLNGVDLLGAEYNAPYQTDWRKTLTYNTYEVPTALLSRINALAAVLGNGMYNVPGVSGRYTKWVGSFGPRMLLAALVVTLTDGSNVTVSSDSQRWLGTDGGPVVFSHEYGGEDRNATLEVPGYDRPGFNPAAANPLVAWKPAVDCSRAYPGGALRPAAAEPIAVMETLPAVSIVPSTPPGTMLVDVGRNFAGFATVSVADVPASMAVRVWPSETMYNGAIDQSSGGTPVFWQYFPDASAPNGSFYNVTLAPTFSTYGWRWLAVQLIPTTEAKGPNSFGPNGTITVLNATYGYNCNPSLAGDATAAVAAFCNGRDPCNYQVCVCGDNVCDRGAPPCMPDPAAGCAKDFTAVWRCTADAPGFTRSVYLGAEANNHIAALGCGPPPPPPLTPNITAAAGHFVRAAVKTVGTWHSSNAWVNRIHNITLEAFAANLQSVLTDCPHRERLGWLEVSHLMFPSMAYNYDISRLWAKLALDTVDSQLANGMVPDIAPEYTVFSGAFRDSPEWGSAAVQNPAWLYSWYGDLHSINATWPTAVAYVDYLLSQRTPAGLLDYGLGDWIPVVNSPVAVTATGMLVQNLQVMALSAAALGLAAKAANYTKLAAQTAAAYETAFWSAAAKTYPTQCAAGYPLTLNFSTDPAAARAYLVHDVVGRGNVTTSGEIGNRYALLALADAAGGPDAVWASLLRTDAPGYGWMLTMNETALAESWFDNKGESHLHAMYGHIDEYLYKHVAGIAQAPGSVGWRKVRFAPRVPMAEGVGGFVNATFASPRGLIASSARIEAHNRVTLAVTCPVAVDCELLTPLTQRLVAVPSTGRTFVVVDELA